MFNPNLAVAHMCVTTLLALVPTILIMTFFPALSGFDSRKAHGPDRVPPVVPKKCASELAPFLVKLFRLCLSTSTYPSCWKFAHIQPVPKKGDRSNPSNYRSIALISCFSKAFEFVFNKKIMRYVSAHNLHLFYFLARGASRFNEGLRPLSHGAGDALVRK